MEILQNSNVRVSNGNIKCPIGNSNFAVNLELKPFRATVANADTRSLKSFHTLFDTYLDYMLAKFEANRIVRNVQNFELFDKKKKNKQKIVFNTIFDKTLTPFCKTLLQLKQLFIQKTINFQTTIFQCSKIQSTKTHLQYYDTCNQIKSCIKSYQTWQTRPK